VPARRWSNPVDELYLAIEHEVNGLIDAVWAYRTEENPDVGFWEPVAELPIPFLDGAVAKCPRWRATLEKLLGTALARWPRPGMPFETVNPRLQALRTAALAMVNEKVGTEGEGWDRWVAATNRIGSILLEVRAMATAAGAAADQGRAASPERPLPPARHSEDFRSVHWYGDDFAFTPTQAACVKVLWLAWENGTPELGQATILEHPVVEAESRRLVDVFKGHPAWDKMIVKGRTAGTYRLAVPPAGP
jgi:hypothetical protein